MTLHVGLVGAGPWATDWHVPMLTTCPDITLAAVWARRREAAEDLAQAAGTVAVGSFDELLARCGAVAFAVPPDVQAVLAPRAAAAGRHLLLEKPLAFGVEEARAIADAVDVAGVRTLLMLRNRFSAGGRRFLSEVASTRGYGGQARFLSGAALEGARFATPWRVARGALLDLGPHVLDLLEAALGQVVDVSAAGDPLHWLAITTTHEGGALGQSALSITTPGGPGALVCRVSTDDGEVVFDGSNAGDDSETAAAIAAEFVETVRSGRPCAADVHRGVHLQELLGRVEGSLDVRR